MRIPKSIRWFVLGALARHIARLAASRSVDKATEDLQQVLPSSASKVISVLPDSVLRAGGAAVATGKATRRAAGTTRVAKQVASGQTENLRSALERSRSLVTSGRGAIAAESADQRRRFRSELALQLRGQKEADEALLDLRETDLPIQSTDNRANNSGPLPEGLLSEGFLDDPRDHGPKPSDPRLPTPADAVPKGRPKRESVVKNPVARVQRLYRPPVKPWDRPH